MAIASMAATIAPKTETVPRAPSRKETLQGTIRSVDELNCNGNGNKHQEANRPQEQPHRDTGHKRTHHERQQNQNTHRHHSQQCITLTTTRCPMQQQRRHPHTSRNAKTSQESLQGGKLRMSEGFWASARPEFIDGG